MKREKRITVDRYHVDSEKTAPQFGAGNCAGNVIIIAENGKDVKMPKNGNRHLSMTASEQTP